MGPEKNQRASREVNKFRELARDVIGHFLGGTKRISYLSGGLTNFVFAFSTSDGDFIIRISPEPGHINAFTKEQWAVRAAREAGVPAPEILQVGLDMIEFPYMITRATEGEAATHHPKRLEILRQLGELGSVINSIRTKGFGENFDWSENKLSFNKTLKEWFENEYKYDEKIGVLLKHRMIPKSRAKRLRRIFADSAKTTVKPVLNHSDLRLKNVIANEDGKINAVIDWESCISNTAPAWELSLALHDLGIDEIQAFLEGYGIGRKKLENEIDLIRAYNITNYAPAVATIAESGDRVLLEQYRLRLSGTLDLYSI